MTTNKDALVAQLHSLAAELDDTAFKLRQAHDCDEYWAAADEREAYAKNIRDAMLMLTENDLPRGIAGAVGPDTTGPSEAMRNAD